MTLAKYSILHYFGSPICIISPPCNLATTTGKASSSSVMEDLTLASNHDNEVTSSLDLANFLSSSSRLFQALTLVISGLLVIFFVREVLAVCCVTLRISLPRGRAPTAPTAASLGITYLVLVCTLHSRDTQSFLRSIAFAG